MEKYKLKSFFAATLMMVISLSGLLINNSHAKETGNWDVADASYEDGMAAPDTSDEDDTAVITEDSSETTTDEETSAEGEEL